MDYVLVFEHEDRTGSYLITRDPVHATQSVIIAAMEEDNPVISKWCSLRTLRAAEIYDEIRANVRNGGDFTKVLMSAVDRIEMSQYDRVEKISDTTFVFNVVGSVVVF